MKQCTRCNEIRETIEFYKAAHGNGLRGVCKHCITADGIRWHRQRIADRRDDLETMLAGGENAEGAARRLGMQLPSLERWCYRHAPDLWRRLNHEDMGYVHTGRVGWVA